MEYENAALLILVYPNVFLNLTACILDLHKFKVKFILVIYASTTKRAGRLELPTFAFL